MLRLVFIVKNILIFIALLGLLSFDTGNGYLEKIPSYQKDSYYKQKVFVERSWKSFYQLKDAQAFVDPEHYDLHLLNAALYFATNKLRENKGGKVLKYSPQLRDAAMVHTSQMIERNFFDHYNRLNPALRSPEQRIKLFGLNSNAMAENVDYTYIPVNGNTTYLQVADKIVDNFFHSPPHRKNMLGKEFTHIGCAAMFETKDKQGVRYIKATQDFSADY